MPMLITDPCQDDNTAFCKLSGNSEEELIGRNCRLLQGENTDPEAIAKIRVAIAMEEDLSIDILNYRKDGSAFRSAPIFRSLLKRSRHS